MKLAATLALMLLAASPVVAGDEVLLEYAEARQIAIDENRPIMVIVSSDSCLYCDLIKREVKKSKAAGRMVRLLIAVVNVSRQPEYIGTFPAIAFPTVYLYDRKLKHRWEGYKTQAEIESIVRTQLNVQ